MSRSGARLVAILLLIVGAAAIAAVAYQIGVSAATAGATTGPATAHAGWWWHGAIGFPWFFFGPVAFLLFIVVVIWVLRAAAWGGRGGGWHGERWSDGPGRFDEWHRRAHDRMGGRGPREGADDPEQVDH